MSAIPVWAYAVMVLAGAVAAALPYLSTLAHKLERPAPQPNAASAAPTYSRAEWINQLVTLSNTAESLEQTDVATASRALISALVAVREKA